MKILLTNEEGCFSTGIITLAKVLSLKHRVNIVAPLLGDDGVGHSFTTSAHPLRVQQWYDLRKVKIFSVNGTPCDCVTLALDKILKSKPDLIISGIDSRNNRGETIYTSGTVSAAIEGTIQGIKSIAIGSRNEGSTDERDFLPEAEAVSRLLNSFVKSMPKGVTLNINFPANFSKKRIKYCALTDGLISNKYQAEVNPFGTTFYWLKSPKMGFGIDALEQKGDLYWLKKNYITVTPLKLNLTNDKMIPDLETAGFKL
jgi:5'-nucleotidase